MGTLTRNSPYDLDLSHNAPRATGSTTADSPFSVGELERILRPFDRDAGALSPRLAQLTGNTLLQYHRGDLTTDSFSVPAPRRCFRLPSATHFSLRVRSTSSAT